MKMDFKIRIAQQSDSAELRDLYKNTVLVVNRRDYSQDEVEDWASCGDDLSNKQTDILKMKIKSK